MATGYKVVKLVDGQLVSPIIANHILEGKPELAALLLTYSLDATTVPAVGYALVCHNQIDAQAIRNWYDDAIDYSDYQLWECEYEPAPMLTHWLPILRLERALAFWQLIKEQQQQGATLPYGRVLGFSDQLVPTGTVWAKSVRLTRRLA